MYKANCGVYAANSVTANTDITSNLIPSGVEKIKINAFEINCSAGAHLQLNDTDIIQCTAKHKSAGYTARVNMNGKFFVDIEKIKVLDTCNINGLTYFYNVIQETVAAPVFSLPSAPVERNTPIMLTTLTKGANIVISINGGTTFKYDEPILITGNTEITAYAEQNGYTSETVSAWYIVAAFTDTVPYLFRRSGGGLDIGNRENDKLVGATVAWNQLVDTLTTDVTLTTGHKHLTVISGVESVVVGEGTSISVTGGTDMVTDLTLCFGSAIADYVYSLETATAGSGIAWLKSYGFFTKNYYAYNAGKLESVNASAHITKGFNQFDKSSNITLGKVINSTGGENSNSSCFHSDYIRVCPGNTYYFNWSSIANVYKIACYDINKTFIKTQSSSALPDNCAYIIINALQSELDTVCLNLSQPDITLSPHNGDYVPYSENVYALDSTLTLNGLYKLDANNKLYCDGDTYESDGTVTRKYGKVDLGTLTWNYRSDIKAGLFSANISDYLYTGNVGAICNKYEYKGTVMAALYINADKTCAFYYYGNSSPRSFYVHDTSYTDAVTFKAAMSGVYLVYELATPTTETADPFTNPQLVDKDGTEEYIDAGVKAGTRDIAIPVGHETIYN